ncbi:actin-like [Coregonus clupeaformis]|uniref:actin-like n=1 Tax=Coregonus clupeaformis TaxID=59861 RepID=UPI001BDFEB8F|nr:actin-like [Coregonus clupeaformis]
MEATWGYSFGTRVKTPFSESPVLLTEFPLTTHSDRERTCKMMFEGLGVPALYLAPQSLLALLSSGRVTGCMVDCGYDVTHAVPVFEGHCLPHAVRQLGLGGQDVTARLALLLKESGAQFSSATQEHDTVTNIKEEMCYVSTDPSSETATTIINSADADYQLPDEQMLRIGSERFGAPEILFSPQTVRMVTQGIPSLLVSSVLESDVDLRQLLLDNAVLAGGSSLLPRMGHRLREEASALAPPGDHVGPVPVMDTAWLGGSFLSSLSIFGDMCISALEYQEMGSNVIHHKCF